MTRVKLSDNLSLAKKDEAVNNLVKRTRMWLSGFEYYKKNSHAFSKSQKKVNMYKWIVFLHVTVIFVFLVQHAAEIISTFKFRAQKEPEGIATIYSFMPNNSSRNLRITYLLIILTGAVAGFMSTWWKQGWMWTSLGVMIIIWILMYYFGGKYLTAVDAITDEALKHKDQPSAIDKFRRDLRARREPEIMTSSSIVGMLIILWLMMFKPF